MSDLYDVRAVSRSNKDLVLEVKVVHPDAMDISADRSFALMMLRDTVEDTDPLAREVSLNDSMDKDWLKKYAAGFISAVRVTGVKDAPPAAARKDSHHRYWDEPKNWMSGQLYVTVTDPAWIAHIKPGATWSSAAFCVTSTYDEHAPITPAAAAQTVDAEGMFVWIPRESLLHLDLTGLPALVEVPAYAETNYAVDEVMKAPIDVKRLRAWNGRPVRAEGEYWTRYGALVIDEREHISVVSSDTTGSGAALFDPPKSVGLLKPIAGRPGAKLEYEKILDDAVTSVVSSEKRGTSLELEVRLPPDGRVLPIRTETDIINILVTPLRYKSTEQGEYTQFKPSALSKALEQDLASRDMEGAHRIEEIYPEIAKQYVASLDINAPARAKNLHLDGLSHEEVRKALAEPWPVATVRVEVTDKKWLAHFEIDQPIALRRMPWPKPTTPPPPPAPVAEAKPAAAAAPADRAVLWSGDTVWFAERQGAKWTARWGNRSKEKRQVKEYALASDEKAKAAFDKAVAAKKSSGYKRAPATEAAAAIVRKRIGLGLDDASGAVVVTKAGPPCENVEMAGLIWCKRGDRVTGLLAQKSRAEARVSTIEEIAIWLEPLRVGEEVWVHVSRNTANIAGSLFVKLR
jgi:predicted DNA-binding WGR domain protein